MRYKTHIRSVHEKFKYPCNKQFTKQNRSKDSYFYHPWDEISSFAKYENILHLKVMRRHILDGYMRGISKVSLFFWLFNKNLLRRKYLMNQKISWTFTHNSHNYRKKWQNKYRLRSSIYLRSQKMKRTISIHYRHIVIFHAGHW